MNQRLVSNDEVKLTDPFNLDAPDFLPMNDSPVLTASIWYEAVPTGDSKIDQDKVAASVYPNPFSESATISVDLEISSNVSVNVYDVTGNLVKSVVNEMRAAGRQEFTVSLIRKGVYLAEVKVNNNKQVLKLVVR